MVDGWKPVVIPDEMYDKIGEYYEQHKDELRLRDGVRSRTALIGHWLREIMKQKEII